MIKEQKQIIYFFLKALLLYVLWYFIYDLWLYKVGWLDNLIIDNLISLSEKILKTIGYLVFVNAHDIGIDGSHGVHVGSPCNGIDLMALFIGFIILFKGRWKDKVWFGLLGLLIIHILNLLRVVALIILAKEHPESLDFNHKYTFTIILYGLIFLGWVLWVKKFSNKTL